MLTENEIYQIITEDVTVCAEKLVQKANDSGGYDNITAIIIQNS